MIPLAPLWADAGEWVKIAFVLVPVVVYALNRLLSGEGQQQKPPLRRPEQAPRPAPKPVAAPAERKRIDDEVGDFLRRAAQQRAAAQGQPAQRSQPAAAAAPKPARRPLVERPVATRPNEVEAVEVEVLDDVQAGRSVAAHVQQHLGRRTVAQRGPKGEEVEHAVEELQSHLHQAFDHQVGQLAARAAPEDSAKAAPQVDAELPTANQLRILLASPQGVGQAIVLGEVLRRPEERW